MISDIEMAQHFLQSGDGKCHLLNKCHEGICPIETRGMREGRGTAT